MTSCRSCTDDVDDSPLPGDGVVHGVDSLLSYTCCAAGECTVSVHIEVITRSFAQRIPNGERRESLKLMLLSCSIRLLDDHHLHKGQPEKDMLVV